MTDLPLVQNLEVLPPLSDDEADDAAFRIRDRLWANIADLFQRYHEEQDLTYAHLGRRVGRSRSQIQRWLSSPQNMTMSSAGLLIAGLGAELDLALCPSRPAALTNRAHPCEEARAQHSYTVVYTPKNRSSVAESQILDAALGTVELVDEERLKASYKTVRYESV